MAFLFPELIIESIIKDGLENARNLPLAVDDVFSEFTKPHLSKKYGQAEIDKIHQVIQGKEVSVVHSFALVKANLPCISLQLISDQEDVQKASLGDHYKYVQTPLSSAELLQNEVISNFQPSGYDPNTGRVSVPDSVSLTDVYAGLLFQDAAGAEFSILGGIDNTPGKKGFSIQKQATVSLDPGAKIKSPINEKKYRVLGNVENTTISVGIHTENALMTKYLYQLVKYFILSRKRDIEARGLELSTYQGSDFNRNFEYQGDVVFSRFLTISGVLLPDWRGDLVKLIDSVDVVTKVPKDEKTTDDLEIGDQTVQVGQTPQE